MADEPLPVPDDAPPADPFEAELVAYLDGEARSGRGTQG